MAINTININPEMLIWARKRARYSQDKIAHKIGTTLNKYKKFETSEASPTMRQLYLLSKWLNRASLFFFMDTPPDEPDVLREMRRLPGSVAGGETPELTYRISLILDYREMALRLFEALDEEIPTVGLKATQGDDPERLATKIRDWLDVSVNEQASWHNERYTAQRAWREALENVGVLVFQIPFVELDEMRGLSIPYHPLPIIGVNSKDAVKGRIFTIFHELTHIIIGESVLDSSEHELWDLNPDFKVEQYCNHVSAAILIPREDIMERSTSMGKGQNAYWHIDDIRVLANKYVVSWEVITRRLRRLNRISTSSYNDILRQLRNYVPPKKSDGGDPFKTSISRVGTLLSELAFRGYYANHITESDLSSLFNLKIKSLGRVEELTLGANLGFGE